MIRAAIFAAVVLVAAPTPHTDLKSSEPAANSRLTTAPRRIKLWFTAKPQASLSRVSLIGASGDVALGPLTGDTVNALRADIPTTLANGAYTIKWKTASADGHEIEGEIHFAVGDSAVIQPAPAHDHEHMTHEAGPPPVGGRLGRLLEYVGLIVVLGVIVFVHGVLPPLAARGVFTADASASARGIGAIAAVAYLVAAGVRLLMQATALRTADEASMQTMSDIVVRSAWGNGWSVGAVGAALAIIGMVLARKRVAFGAPTALTGAFAMILSAPLSGHAVASKLFIPGVTADAVHVASIGAWIGTLTVVLLVGIPAMKRLTDGNADAAVSALVNSFHPIALLAAPLTVLAGVASSIMRLGSVAALGSTRYGGVLIVKVASVLLVAGVGLWNSTRARRRLGNSVATMSLKRSIAMELTLALLVIWVTTDLVATPVPSEMAP